MLSGIGDFYAETLNLPGGATEQRIIELYLFDFNFTSESTPRKAKGFVKGIKKTKSSAIGEIEDTLVISTQYVDWNQLGFALNEFPKTASSIKLPMLKQATVPSSGAYEIVDAAITVANLNYIKAAITAYSSSWGQPISLDYVSGSPSAGQVQVDTTNTKLVFHSSAAGASISYSVPTDYTSIEMYGGTGSATKWGKVAFRGKLHTPESTDNWYIEFPSLSRESEPSFNLSEDIPTLEMTFAAEVPAGWEKPYRIFNLDTGT